MAHRTLVLHDESGTDHEVGIPNPETVVINGREIRVVSTRPGEFRAGDRVVWAAANGEVRWAFVDGRVYLFETRQAGAAARPRMRHPTGLSAPMPATVVKIPVSVGEAVRAGDVLVVLEAMKMELPVRAHVEGVVAALRCRVGELVQPGHDLIEITPPPRGSGDEGSR